MGALPPDPRDFRRHELRCPMGEEAGPRATCVGRGPARCTLGAPSAELSLAGCVPAEPASVSLGGEMIATTAGRSKGNDRAAGEGGKSVAKKWAFLV